MSKRTLVMVAAVALAALVMLLAYLAEPDAPAPVGQSPATTRPAGVDPSWQAGNFDTQGRPGGRTPPIQGVGDTQFTRINEKGQLEVYKGDPITPLPGGWWQVGKPEFTFHLADHRALRLRAEAGHLYAPAEPRSGTLTGQVRLEYFDTEDETRKAIIGDGSDDLRFLMQMQAVQFDRDLLRMETDGPFHLTSREFDFVGQQLRLVYSDAQRRIETLQVGQSQWLRINPRAGRRQTPATAPATQASQPATQPVAEPVARPQTAPASQPEDTSPHRRPVQFYRAIFPVDVRIHSPQAQLTCQELELIFSLDEQASGTLRSSVMGKPSRPDQSSAAMLAAALETGGSPIHQAMTQIMLWTLAQTTQPDIATAGVAEGDALLHAAQVYAQSTLAPPTEDDILITWNGTLAVTPIAPEEAAAASLAQADDIRVRMTGRPVRIQGQRGELATAARLHYQVNAGRLTMLGDASYPVELDSPQLGGVLTAAHFTLEQTIGTGQVQGPGMIRAYDLPASQAQEDNQKLPAGFTIAWQDGLDLSFYKRQDTGREKLDDSASTGAARLDRNPIQLAALRQATFHGQVAVSHPQFEVRSHELSLSLTDPARSRQAVDALNARGQVMVSTRSQLASEQGSIACDNLDIVLGVDAVGRAYPDRLIAQDHVVAHTAEGQLKTTRLTAYLNPSGMPPTTQAITQDVTNPVASPSSQPVSSGLALMQDQPIRQLVAEDGVDIDMTDRGMRIFADRLVTDFGPTETQVELFGQENAPVRVQREGMLMSGPRVVLTRFGRTLHIPGAGSMAYHSQEPMASEAPTGDSPLAVTASPTTDRSARLVTIHWQQAMHFDDRGGAAQFLGDVVVQGSQADESTRLVCQDLRLEFVRDQDKPGASPATRLAQADTSDRDMLMQGVSEVRSVVARESVVFEAQAMGDDTQRQTGKPESRVRIVGDMMTFDGPSQQVRVIGPGSMSIEDYRPSRPGAAEAQVNPASPNLVAGLPMRGMVGRGATAFRWLGGLVLDAQHNDMIMNDTVQMLHMPLGGDQPFQMDCMHLVADLESTGGLGSISQAPTPRLNAVFADDAVRLLMGDRQITTDHLEFNGKNEVVILTADEGRYTTISEAKTPVPLTYKQVRWYLRNNRFEGIAPGRGVVPLLKDPRRPATR